MPNCVKLCQIVIEIKFQFWYDLNNMKSKNLNRRDFLKTITSVAATGALASLSGCAASNLFSALSKKGKRPNIVFVLSDDHRADLMGCAGNPYINTPNFDRMAKEGMMFENAFVTSAVCSPSRASFLTGKEPHQCGVPTILTMWNSFHRDEKTFPELLQKSGYETGYFGKWHLGEGQNKKRGFDHWAGFHALGSYFDPAITINGKEKKFKGFTDDVVSKLAADYIKKEAKEDKPFCVFVGLKAPHLNFSWPKRLEHAFDGVTIPKPDSFDENYDKTGKPALKNPPYAIQIKTFVGGLPAFDNSWEKYVKDYYRSSLSIDNSLGTIMKAIDETGEADDTILIYTSDHGYSLGEHGMTEKHFAYEGIIRVPMLMKYPKMIKPGSTRKEMVLNSDVAPTLLDLADAKIPKDISGLSWKPLLKSDKKPKKWREDFLYHFEETCLAVRTDRYKLIEWCKPENCWELYDLKNDPKEMKNLINDPKHSKIKKKLERRLKELKIETNWTPTTHSRISEAFFLGPFGGKTPALIGETEGRGRLAWKKIKADANKEFDIKKLCSGKSGDNFLIKIIIKNPNKNDPCLRLAVAPVHTPITGYANGEELYQRMKTGRLDPFNIYFNPPLKPGDNTIIFKGKIKDLPKLSINAIVMKGRVEIF